MATGDNILTGINVGKNNYILDQKAPVVVGELNESGEVVWAIDGSEVKTHNLWDILANHPDA